MGETYALFFYYLLGFATLFGLAIGSFLNVVIYRVPENLSVVAPGSRCPTCETPIAWYDNIPVVSWLVLRARCRHCDASISGRYALVEALVGSLAAVVWWQVGNGLVATPLTVDVDFIAYFAVFSVKFVLVALLVTIAFVDLDHFIIPHVFTVPGMILGLASPWLLQWLFGFPSYLQIWPPVTPIASIVGFLAGGLVILGVFYLYLAARGLEGLGGGDLTLMAMLGAWFGPGGVVFVLFAASVQGLVVAGVTMALGIDFVTDSSEIFDDPDDLDDLDDLDDSESNASEQIENAINSFEEDAASVRDPGEHPEEVVGEQQDPAAEIGWETEPEAEGASEVEFAAPAGDEDPRPEYEPVGDVSPTDEESARDVLVDPEDEPLKGLPAVPFGPFIALAALEYLLLGPYLPDSLSMASLNFLF